LEVAEHHVVAAGVEAGLGLAPAGNVAVAGDERLAVDGEDDAVVAADAEDVGAALGQGDRAAVDGLEVDGAAAAGAVRLREEGAGRAEVEGGVLQAAERDEVRLERREVALQTGERPEGVRVGEDAVIIAGEPVGGALDREGAGRSDGGRAADGRGFEREGALRDLDPARVGKGGAGQREGGGAGLLKRGA
jgi:hypothetical protein